MRTSRRALPVAALSLTLLTAVTTGLSAAPEQRAASGAKTYDVPANRSMSLVGQGYGHGRGMSQHGAQGAALAGKGHRKILSFYYPGTAFGQRRGPLRVLITADTSSDVVVEPSAGLRVRDLGSGRARSLPERAGVQRWRITPMRKNHSRSIVQYRTSKRWVRWEVLSGDGQFSAPGALRLVSPDGSSARYRGSLRSASPYRGSTVRDTVNVVAMDDYIRGVVGAEMPSSWQPQALRAQAVAARTYAAYERFANRDRYWHTCDTTSCQVYGGVHAEAASVNQAVDATAHDVLLFGGDPAFTQFSASSGGWTVAGSQRYLRAKRDRWDDWSGNTNRPWRQSISAASMQAAYPQLGRLQRIRISRRDGNGRWGGRVLQVQLLGSAGSVSLSGDDLRYRFGLRSTLFTIRSG